MKCPNCTHEFELDLAGLPPKSSPVHDFIAGFCERYKAVKGTNPVANSVAAKVIVKSVGLSEALRLTDVYLAMKDQFFITRGHDMDTMRANLTKIKLAADTGTVTSRAQATQSERGAANAAAIRRAIEQNNGS